MEDNPYVELLQMMRQQGKSQIPVTIRFGTIISANPLKVDVGNTVQEKDDLLKNADIGELHSGDTVLLVPIEDNQRHIIICRVVGV